MLVFQTSTAERSERSVSGHTEQARALLLPLRDLRAMVSNLLWLFSNWQLALRMLTRPGALVAGVPGMPLQNCVKPQNPLWIFFVSVRIHFIGSPCSDSTP